MVSKATVRYIRISPRKTRLVTNFIKGKGVGEALALLGSINKKACGYIEELLRSAMANAKANPEIKDEDLFISKIVVDGGPVLKRYRAASMGRASMVLHRTSHIHVELDAIKRSKPQEEKKGRIRKRRSIK